MAQIVPSPLDGRDATCLPRRPSWTLDVRQPILTRRTRARPLPPQGADVAVATLTPTHGHRAPATGSALAKLALGALGVVYGDIGTSPLYALKECFTGHHGVSATPANVLGVLSLVFWAMTFVVTFKYLSFVMRADNRGEGGILALLALVGKHEARRRGSRQLLINPRSLRRGAALRDGVITPAISVLGAVEGLSVAAPALGHWVVPITVGILALLFFIQKRGTAVVGAVFGPVMLVWFVCIAILGIRGIPSTPRSCRRSSPPTRSASSPGMPGTASSSSAAWSSSSPAARRCTRTWATSVSAPSAWPGSSSAMPALLLNYMGQGAMLLHEPEAARNPFYLLVPGWALYPMIAIATAAAIVASQALISGAFSLTRQAVQLGYSPRVTIRHTSSTEIGQICVPEVNALLGVATIALVLGFKTSSNLAAAYGIAVTGTMAITTMLFHRVARDLVALAALACLAAHVAVHLRGPRVLRREHREGRGGRLVPARRRRVRVHAALDVGREALAEMMREAGLPLDVFLDDIARRKPQRVPGTAVFMTGTPARSRRCSSTTSSTTRSYTSGWCSRRSCRRRSRPSATRSA